MPHSYSHHAPDPIVGIRLGVNAADMANSRRLAPRGAVMKRAAELALLQQKVSPRNVRPTIRVEHLLLAIDEKGGEEITSDRVREMMIEQNPALELQRGQIARTRYAETRAMKEAAKLAKREERAAKRAARKAAKLAAQQ